MLRWHARRRIPRSRQSSLRRHLQPQPRTSALESHRQAATRAHVCRRFLVLLFPRPSTVSRRPWPSNRRSCAAMTSDLEASQDMEVGGSTGSSQEEDVLLVTPKAGGLSTCKTKKRTPASEKRKHRTPDPEKEEAKRQRLEAKAKREEEKKQKEEERQKRQEERRAQQEQRNEAKRKAEEEKQRQNEEKRKQADEKKRAADEEKRMKMEEKQKRDEEKRQKEDERQRRQEERRKQVEERQRQEEEKQRALEEEQRRKERTSHKFRTFFKKVPASPAAAVGSDSRTSDHQTCLPFLPFQLKPNQTLAPVVQDFVKQAFEIGVFDSLFLGQYATEMLYLKELATGVRKPIKVRTQVRKSGDSEVILLSEENSKKWKGKLLQFHTNRRPAWYGTWNKRSPGVTGRRPFGRDTRLDYDVDSDEEWEEEEEGEGESLVGSDNEGEPEDDYEIDNEFMVPHGYLSGDEEENADEAGEEGTCFREKEMIARKNMRVKPLKPISIGCIWSHQAKREETAFDFLKKLHIVFNARLPAAATATAGDARARKVLPQPESV